MAQGDCAEMPGRSLARQQPGLLAHSIAAGKWRCHELHGRHSRAGSPCATAPKTDRGPGSDTRGRSTSLPGHPIEADGLPVEIESLTTAPPNKSLCLEQLSNVYHICLYRVVRAAPVRVRTTPILPFGTERAFVYTTERVFFRRGVDRKQPGRDVGTAGRREGKSSWTSKPRRMLWPWNFPTGTW